MNRIPIARLIRENNSAVAYYDDYWDDYCERDTTNDPSIPDTQPDVVLEGDQEIVSAFDIFLLDRERHLDRGYYPYPWSRGVALVRMFADQFRYTHENIFPQELRDEVAKAYNPNTLY